jgi:hypothetical protein
MLVIVTKSGREGEPSRHQPAGLAGNPPEAAERRVHGSRVPRIEPGMRNVELRRAQQGLDRSCH